MQNQSTEIFIPLYIDKNRLLDINSILFDGYSEFSETTLERENQEKKTNNASVKAGTGMKIFNLGSTLDSSNNDSNKSTEKFSLKKIQTSSSLLANTLEILKRKRILKNESSCIGDFIEFRGKFKNNAICDLLDQFIEMMSFAEQITKMSEDTDTKEIIKAKDTIKKIKQIVKINDDRERELVCIKDDKVYVIHVLSDNVYNSSLDNINNKELTYFCQIKNITKDYMFFSDTQLSKFDPKLLEEFISMLKGIINECNSNGYHFDFELVHEIKDKTVYELELISIYRKNSIGVKK